MKINKKLTKREKMLICIAKDNFIEAQKAYELIAD